MTAVLAEVGKRLLDRWLTLLVLPGLLYVAAAVVGAYLGHGHALDVHRLSGWITDHLATSRSANLGAVLLAVAAALFAAAASGLCAAVLGRLTGYLWTLPARTAPLRRLARRRRDRWVEANARVADAVGAALGGGDTAGVAAAIAARNRIGLVEPTHPTWIGDRLTAPAARVNARYGLDLAAAWPRLWLVVPESVRGELAAAHAAYTATARLVGWTTLYAVLALLWWPAALAAAVLGITAYAQSRAAVTTLADLTEAVVDLYGTDLAVRLGIPHPDGLTPGIGRAVTIALRKDHIPAPDQPPSLTRRTASRP